MESGHLGTIRSYLWNLCWLMLFEFIRKLGAVVLERRAKQVLTCCCGG